MANRIFKLEIDTDGQIKEKISFGPRIPGEVGRDVMVVKYALGIIENYSELINRENKKEFDELGIDDPNGWFDCVDGKPVTSLQAATFDRSLQNYVKKYQIDNQFYMLCYYFTKFAIPETLVEKNSILTVGTFDSPINEVMKQKEIASWVKTGINEIYLSGGKSIKLPDELIEQYKNHSFLSNQIDLIVNMFNNEFGTIGEATLAIMHGWLPRTRLYNKGFQFDPEVFSSDIYAHDLVLKVLFDSFVSKNLSQKPESEIVPKNQEETDLCFKKYRSQVSLSERIDLNTDVSILGPGSEHYQFTKDHFGAIKYETSSRSSAYKSMLYESVNFISETYPRPDNISAVSNKDYATSLKRMHEPDPATNPDPFQVDEQVIGYFYDTEYTLEKLPPLPPAGQTREENRKFFENSEKIRQLEDAALSEVLSSYGKPQVFYLNTRDKEYQNIFIGEEAPFFAAGPKKSKHDASKLLPAFAGDIPNEEIWVLTTRHYQKISDVKKSSIQFYDEFERNKTGNLYKKDLIEPLIKFVEFRTPSFRPGDTYKAKFFINKAKLDYIKDGFQEQLTSDDLRRMAESERQAYTLGAECNVNMLTGSTPEDNRRRYEEYRAIAEKQKREIARAVRETTFESVSATSETETDPVQIKPDLGVFGKLDINPIKFIQSSDNLSEAAQSALGNLYQNTLDKFVSNPDLSNTDDLTISYSNLKQLTKFASENLKKAYDNALIEKFKFTPSDYNGARQALLLTDLPIELKTCIVKYKKPLSPQFDFNDGVGDSLQKEMAKIGAGAAPTDTAGVSSLSRFSGLGSNIKFTFKGTPGGLKITKITAGNAHVTDPAKIKEFPSLSDPITVAYLAQIYDMTGGKPSALNMVSELLNPFDSFFGACEDVGIGKKSVGYLRKFTPGLKADDSDYDPIKLWYEEEIEGPFNAWYNTSKSNLESMFDSKFNQDQFLALLGKECNLKMLYREFGKKLSISALLCNLFKCLKLPAININIPDLTLPPIDRLDIFGWYRGLIETMIKKFIEILVRLLCTFLRYIIDLLNFPFCEEQLRDQLYGEFASTSPIVQRALVDALSDIGISPESNDGAKSFVDDALAFLTGEEICNLLRGEAVDAATMTMLLKLANARGLEDLSSEHNILKFFNGIGIFIPDEFCDDLEAANWIIATTDCEETTSYIDQLRKRMLAGDASEDDIKKAQELLEGNLKDEAEKFQAFGEQGLAGLLPDVIKFGDPNAIVNDIPGNLKQQTVQSLKSVFETAKMGYLSSLSNFGPSLFVNNSRILTSKDEDYDEVATLGLRTILENFKNYSLFIEDLGQQANEEQNLIKQLNLLHMIYEVGEENGSRIARSYKLGKVPGSNRMPTYNPREHLHLHYYDDNNPWIALADSQVASQMDAKKDDPCLKPIGYSEYEYFEVGDDGRPKITGEVSLEASENNKQRFNLTIANGRMDSLDREAPSVIEVRGYTLSNLNNFSFQRNYLVERKAEKLDAELAIDDPDKQFLTGLAKQVLLTAIENRIKRMQSDLVQFLNMVAKPTQGEEYLGGIRDLFSAANETMLEGIKDRNRGRKDIIRATSKENEDGSLLLDMNSGGLRTTIKYREFPSVFTAAADPYSVEIYNDNMFRRTSDNPLVLEYCDTITGPDPREPSDADADSIYKEAIRDLPPGLYTRRELFARKVMSSLQGLFGDYFPNPTGHTATYSSLLDPSKAANQSYFKKAFSGKLYSNSMEGIFEQIFFGLRNSKIYDLDRYYPGLEKRVSGETNFDASSGCYKNRFNVSQLSILSFEKVITDEIGKQLSIELAKPENAPQNIDYNKPGPIEKALQNVCFIGFIRICLVELLLKGALAYSVWDFEGVFDEPVMHGFVYEYIKSELNRKEPMRQNWEQRSVAVTGIENPEMALKKIVRNQSMKMLDLSKKIYENKPSDETDYRNWYSEIFIPQTHISRNISIRGGNISVSNFNIDMEANINESVVDYDSARSRQENSTLASDKIYWSHPLLDRKNIITKQSYSNSTIGLGLDMNSVETMKKEFQQLPQGNDPFFHIEHLVKVTGPLASVESLVIPGSVLTNEILRADARLADDANANWKHYRKITTSVSSEAFRTPKRMNIMDARDRTSLFKVNPDEYGFSSRPSLPAAARGASLEDVVILDEDGRIPSNKYKHATELFHIEDFKEALDFKVSDKNLKKLEHHLEGLMSYNEPGEPQIGNLAYQTSVKDLDGQHPSVLRAPGKFVKHTRRIIKFSSDFVSHNLQDFCDFGNLEDYHTNLYSPLSETINKYIGNSTPSEQATIHYAQFNNAIESATSTTRYRIVGGSAENYYVIRDLLNKAKEDERRSILDNPAYNLEESIYSSDIPRDIAFSDQVDDKLEKKIETIIHGTDPIVDESTRKALGEAIQKDYNFDLKGDFIHTEDYFMATKNRGGDEKGFHQKGMIRADRSIKENRARVTLDSSTNPTATTNPNEVDQITTRKTEDEDSEVIIYTNPIGTFNTEEEYEDAKRRTFSYNERPARGNHYNAAYPVYVKPREEHWVETIYEFSGDSAILAGLYGSNTIGETFDPAVLNFKPSQSFRSAWTRLGIKIKDLFGEESWLLYKQSPQYAYGKTFYPKETPANIEAIERVISQKAMLDPDPGGGSAGDFHTGEWTTYQQAQIFLGKEMRQANIPLISRPMGIDKHTNMRLTSKLLIRSNVRHDIAWHTHDMQSPTPEYKNTYLSMFAPYGWWGSEPPYRTLKGHEHPEIKKPVEDGAAIDSTFRGIQVLAKCQPIWAPAAEGGASRRTREWHSMESTEYHRTSYRDICKYVHKKPSVSWTGSPAKITLSYGGKTDLLPPNIYKVPIRIMVTQIYVEGEVVNAFARILPPKYIKNLKVRPAVDSDTMPSQVLENMAALNKAAKKITDEYVDLLDEMPLSADLGRATYGDLPNSKEYAIAANHFAHGANYQAVNENMLSFPQFTQDFHTNFEPNTGDTGRMNYRMSNIDVGSHNQYCSIERIYSEAFHLEVESDSWNREDVLDEEFKNDRGSLLRRVDVNLGSSYDRLGSISLADSIRHLESLHFFYQLPENTFLGATGESAQSVTDFHRTILSLNSILQPFLRYRSAESLWGMLTPLDPVDVTPSKYGYAGEQKFPLVQSMVSSRKVQPWTIAHNREAAEMSSPSRTAAQRDAYYKWHEDSGAGSSYRAKPMNIMGQTLYKHRFETGLYPVGAMVLCHQWSDGTCDDSNHGYEKNLYTSHIRGRVNKEVSDITNYLRPIRPSDSESKMWDGHPVMDSWGFYYVNYNRCPSFPMTPVGTSIFVGDGKISLDDLSTIFRTAIISLFKKESLSAEANENPYDHLNHAMIDNLGMIFQDRNGNLDASNYRFFMEGLSTLNPPAGDLSFDFSGIEFNSNFLAEEHDYDRIRVINTSLKDRADIGELADMMTDLLGHLIVRVGEQLENRLQFENSFRSIFGDATSTLTQLEFMKRFIKFTKDASIPKPIKIILLWYISGYQVPAKVRDSYFQVVEKKQGQVDARDMEKRDWAYVCLVWYHSWFAWLRPHRHHVDKTWAHPFPCPDGGGAKIPPGGFGSEAFRGFQGNPDFKLSPDNIYDLDTALYTMAFHVASTYHYKSDGHHYVKWCWRRTKKPLWEGDRHDALWKGIMGGKPDKPHPTKEEYYKSFLPANSIDGEPGSRNFNIYLRRNLSHDDIIQAVTTIYADFVLGSTGAKSIANFSTSVSKQLHKHLLGGLNGASPEVLQENYTFPGITKAIKSIYDHTTSLWKRSTVRMHTTKEADYYRMADTWHKDMRQWLLKETESGSTFADEANSKMYIDSYESVEFEGIILNMVNAQQSEFASRKSLLSKVENDMVKVGRLEYLYAYLDFDAFRSIMRSKYLKRYMNESGYAVDDGSVRDDESYVAHQSNILKMAKTSKLASLGHTTALVKRVINNDIFTAYERYGIRQMTSRYLTALRTYTALPQTITTTMFDGAAKINNKIVDGLFTMSKIDQVARLVINFPNPAATNTGLDRGFLKSDTFQLLSEEQRSILMTAVEQQEFTSLSNMESLEDASRNFILSIPVVKYSEPMSKFRDAKESDNFLVDCYQIGSLVSDFNKKVPWMRQELMKQEDSKLFINYIFPTRRFQALSTIFSTTSLSGYSTMPSLMETPKSSISFLMGMTGMNPKERMDMMGTLSQGELYKGLMDTQTSVPRALECFPFPFSGEFLEQFMDMLVEQIKQFPAILFRGLANTIDPAYREMKMHWDDCRIKNLTYSGLKPFTANNPGRQLVAGTHGDNADRNRKYAPLISTTAADLSYSIGMLFANPPKAAKGLLHTTRNLTGYIYKGPMSLFDGAFQFQVPCADIDLGWPDSSTFNLGRYGHPLTPLTLLALAMPELKGDKRLRDLNGNCEDVRNKNRISRAVLENSRFCDEEEEPPFGPMPNPENINDTE